MKPLILVWAMLVLAATAGAQTKVERIRIRVLDGHSGKPVRRVSTLTTVYPLISYRYPIDARTDAQGVASLLVPTDTQISSVARRHPLCQRRDKAQPDAPVGFSVAAILAAGVDAPNTCSHKTAPAVPGELVLFVRPLRWWERFTY